MVKIETFVMRVYLMSLTGNKFELEVDGSTTIEELYSLAWKKMELPGSFWSSFIGLDDGIGLCFAGKRLKLQSFAQLSKENNLSIDILHRFYVLQENLADYNIQKDSTIHVIYFETRCRKRFAEAKKEDCPVCLDQLSNVGIVGYKLCGNGHYFHYLCAKTLTICPMCRTEKWQV